jgi:hypothetical protein
MKAYRGRRNTAPLILNLGIRGRSLENFTLLLIYPRKRLYYPLNKRLRMPEPVGTFSKKRKFFSPYQLYSDVCLPRDSRVILVFRKEEFKNMDFAGNVTVSLMTLL